MGEPIINCCDGCGRSVAEDEVLQAGWTYLEVQKRYRCPQCWRELQQANAPRQADEQEVPR